MRKLSILSYIFAGLMLSSCDGYLKEDPRDQLYPEDAYDTPQNGYPCIIISEVIAIAKDCRERTGVSTT